MKSLVKVINCLRNGKIEGLADYLKNQSVQLKYLSNSLDKIKQQKTCCNLESGGGEEKRILA